MSSRTSGQPQEKPRRVRISGSSVWAHWSRSGVQRQSSGGSMGQSPQKHNVNSIFTKHTCRKAVFRIYAVHINAFIFAVCEIHVKRKWCILASCVCLSANFLLNAMTQTSLPPGSHVTTHTSLPPGSHVTTHITSTWQSRNHTHTTLAHFSRQYVVRISRVACSGWGF